MKSRFFTYVAIGILLVLAGVAGVFYLQRGAHIELRGSILKVRTLPIEANSTAVVLDFRFVNPADYAFIVRRVDVYLEDVKGNSVEGTAIAEVDATRLFEYYPILGQKFNDSLVIRTKVLPGQSMDRMVASRFELPLSEVESRRRFSVRIEDVDGAVSVISEEKQR